MGLNKCRLGEHIKLCSATNADMRYGIEYVRGVNNLKKLMPTKADINDRDLSKFSIVNPGDFVFNHRTSRNGSKFSIAYNDGTEPIICTEDYVVFHIRKESEQILIAEWLYLFFCRSEFDRYVITNSWGSSTEFYNWEDICDVEIDLPPFSIQQKFVAIYKAMVANQQSYERGLEDLKLSIDAEMDKLKRSIDRITLRELLVESDIKNSDGKLTEVQGVNKEKAFMPTVASGEDLSKYKVVPPRHLACNLMHVGRDVALPIALNTTDNKMLVSPAYNVFTVDEKKAYAEYILIWLSREEAGRYAWFLCDSSVRSGLDKKRFFDIAIPLPPLQQQNMLVDLHQAMIMRRNINDQLKTKIRDICPILIKGSVEEAKG